MRHFWAVGWIGLIALTAYHWHSVESLQRRLASAEAALQASSGNAASLGQHPKTMEPPGDARAEESTPQALPGASSTVSPVAGLRNVGSDEAAQSPFISNLLSIAERAADLDRRFKAFPELNLPEIALLSEADWISAASLHPKLETADQVKRALTHLAEIARGKAFSKIAEAVFSERKTEQPQDFKPAMERLRGTLEDAIVDRYEVVTSSEFGPELLKEVQRLDVSSQKKPLLAIRERDPLGGNRRVLVYLSEDGKTRKGMHTAYLQLKTNP